MMLNAEATKEKIALLHELHRPLEEHWAVKSKFGLDAKGSDYIYKHHITRLEDIYVNHKFDQFVDAYEKNLTTFNMTPVSQLYGVNGLLTAKLDNDERKKAKEAQWVDNFHKYAAMDENNQLRPNRSSQSLNNVALHASTKEDNRKRIEEAKQMRSHCVDPHLTQESLIMLGMYRLNTQQQEVYQKFVDMLSEFDNFDKIKIIEDALKDANDDDLLTDYGGTILKKTEKAQEN